MENKQYYLIEIEGSNEGFILFWRPEGKGYTINFTDAGLFEFEDIRGSFFGKSECTIAIEREKLIRLMKTHTVVWNHKEILFKLKEELSNG